MPIEYTVVGEHREDETYLLVVGADGEYHGYVPARELLIPVEPDEDWIIHQPPEELDPELAPADPETP